MSSGAGAKRAGVFVVLGEIGRDERVPVLLLLLNLTIILVSYYVIKVVREPLILSTAGGAQWKSYAAAAQALVLMGYVPLYSWFTSRVNRTKLVLGLNLFFVVNIELFTLGILGNVPFIGVAFYVWVGIFSLSVIAQFWSLANDIYSESQGKRLFPVIAIGATLGSPFGSWIAAHLFDAGLSAPAILQVSAGLLMLSMLMYWFVEPKRAGPAQVRSARAEEKLSQTSGFTLVARNRYLLLMSVLLVLLNIVNTTGEFILSSKVVEAANSALSSNPHLDKSAFIGTFYGDYLFVVSIVALLLQAVVVSRIVKVAGVAGVVLLLPLIALGAYAVIAAGAGLAIIRWMKTAENATDYSVMNTARAMLWLPTSREEKYKAKQAVDTFIVRVGDLLSAGVVFAGVNWLQLRTSGFAMVNVAVTTVWILVSWALVQRYRQLAKPAVSVGAAAEGEKHA